LGVVLPLDRAVRKSQKLVMPGLVPGIHAFTV